MESHSLTPVECKIEKKVDKNDLESLLCPNPNCKLPGSAFYFLNSKNKI